jgi:redox-sensing transcriptional repressor
MNIPAPTITRLCQLFHLLKRLESEGDMRVSSTGLGAEMGVGAHNVRKDINYLGEVGEGSAGYDVVKLRQRIADRLDLTQRKKICIVGLGNLGAALLEHHRKTGVYDVAAGFDSSINRLETIQTDVPVFPAYDIADVVKSRNIELALIAVPAHAAQEAADRLIAGGIRGIINFAQVVIKPSRPEVIVRNVDLDSELLVVSAMLADRPLVRAAEFGSQKSAIQVSRKL